MTDLATERFELTITKRLPATRQEVFDAWLNPEHLKNWISPMGSAAVPLLEPHVGGRYQIDMHGPESTYVHTGEYLEIKSPERLKFTWISDGTGHQESVVTIEISEDDGETLLTLTHEKLPSAESAERHTGGWTAIAENLAKQLSQET